MTRWTALALPILVVLAYDPVAPDAFAVKRLALIAGATVVAAVAAFHVRRFAAPAPALALLAWTAVVAIEAWRSPAAAAPLHAFAPLAAVAVAVVAASATSRRFWLRAMPPVCAGLGLAVTIWVGVQWLSDSSRQAHATFANRNFAGAGLAMLTPFAFAFRKSAGLVVLAGVFATLSRGGMVAVASAAALWLAWSRLRARSWVAIACAALPIAVLLAGLALGDRNTVKVRRHWYAAALSIGAERPLIGHGTGGFAREYPPVRPLEEYQISGGRRVHAVHNDYLERFTDGGALGLLAMLGWLAAAGWAARRWRPAACSLLALATAAVVDLPLQDPSLLALGVIPMLATMRRARRHTAWRVFVAAGALALASLTPTAFSHWQAEHAWGHVLAGESNVTEVLRHNPAHPDALLMSGSQRDIARLLEQEPHRAAAHLAASAFAPEAERRDRWRAILLDHDPHDVATRIALAQDVIDIDRIQAASLLDAALNANPRDWRAHWLRSRVSRLSGRYAEADRFLRKAEFVRRGHPLLARERLEIEIASMREGEVDSALVLYAVQRLDLSYSIGRIEAALQRAARAEATIPTPQLERRDGESVAAFTKRAEQAIAKRRRERRAVARLDYLEALVIAEALTAHRPSVQAYRLRGKAARGLGELERARQMEALALFLETLDSLRSGREQRAAFRWKRALAAHPALPGEVAVKNTLGRFVQQYPDARAAARKLFGSHAELRVVFEHG